MQIGKIPPALTDVSVQLLSGHLVKTEIKKSEFGKIINSLTEIATQEVKSTGVCTSPGVCRIKWRMKPALKAKKRKVFGKVVIVKARPARKVV